MPLSRAVWWMLLALACLAAGAVLLAGTWTFLPQSCDGTVLGTARMGLPATPFAWAGHEALWSCAAQASLEPTHAQPAALTALGGQAVWGGTAQLTGAAVPSGPAWRLEGEATFQVLDPRATSLPAECTVYLVVRCSSATEWLVWSDTAALTRPLNSTDWTVAVVQLNAQIHSVSVNAGAGSTETSTRPTRPVTLSKAVMGSTVEVAGFSYYAEYHDSATVRAIVAALLSTSVEAASTTFQVRDTPVTLYPAPTVGPKYRAADASAVDAVSGAVTVTTAGSVALQADLFHSTTTLPLTVTRTPCRVKPLHYGLGAGLAAAGLVFAGLSVAAHVGGAS